MKSHSLPRTLAPALRLQPSLSWRLRDCRLWYCPWKSNSSRSAKSAAKQEMLFESGQQQPLFMPCAFAPPLQRVSESRQFHQVLSERKPTNIYRCHWYEPNTRSELNRSINFQGQNLGKEMILNIFGNWKLESCRKCPLENLLVLHVLYISIIQIYGQS